jgi:hypothetical protein
MGTISIDGQAFDLIANSIVYANTWVVQVSPENIGFFAGIKGQDKNFGLDDGEHRQMTGYVLGFEIHTLNKDNKNAPQLQVQVNRSGF